MCVGVSVSGAHLGGVWLFVRRNVAALSIKSFLVCAALVPD